MQILHIWKGFVQFFDLQLKVNELGNLEEKTMPDRHSLRNAGLDSTELNQGSLLGCNANIMRGSTKPAFLKLFLISNFLLLNHHS